MPETFRVRLPLLVITSVRLADCPAGRLPKSMLPSSPIIAEGGGTGIVTPSGAAAATKGSRQHQVQEWKKALDTFIGLLDCPGTAEESDRVRFQVKRNRGLMVARSVPAVRSMKPLKRF